MKKLVLSVAAILTLAASASAQTATCSVSGLNAKQTALVADFIASVNAERAAQSPPLEPFADFSAYCVSTMTRAVLDYMRQQEKVNAAKVAAAAETSGDQIAPNPQCSAAALPNGCTKNQVACFVLSGSATCQ